MKILLLALGLTLTLIPNPASAEDFTITTPLKPASYRVGERINDLKFVDINGKEGKLSDFSGAQALVIVLNLIDCPLCRKNIGKIHELEKEYAKQNVSFLMVNVGNHSIDKLKQGISELQIKLRYIPDPEKKFSSELQALTSTEIFVLDPKLTLNYRGPVDDQFGLTYALASPRNHFLQAAIDKTKRREFIEQSALSAPGCALKMLPAPKDETPTYHNRISRLIERNCVSCHRKGQGAPFELGTFEDVVDRASAIRLMVDLRLMPPWYANPKHGKFANDRSLTERDKATLLAWIDAGTPEGDSGQALLPLLWPSQWQLGKPDAEITTPEPIKIAASGVMPYQYVSIKTDYKEDRWLRAFEIKNTFPAVVHHVLVLVKGRDDGINGYFAAKVPGNATTIFPAGLGRRLAKGTELIFQLHYTPNGVAGEDRPTLGLYFSDEKAIGEVSASAVADTEFVIPAGNANYEVKAGYSFKKRTRVFGFMPHMHLRGKAFRYEVVRTDGTRETVLDVPKYDFNWQLYYQLQTPLTMERGDMLQGTAWFDNSSGNPANPNPNVAVKFGEQTTEEMMIGYFDQQLLE